MGKRKQTLRACQLCELIAISEGLYVSLVLIYVCHISMRFFRCFFHYYMKIGGLKNLKVKFLQELRLLDQELLNSLGVTDMFGSNANLRGISEQPLQVSQHILYVQEILTNLINCMSNK